MSLAARSAMAAGRALILILFVAVCTIGLVRYAPGYFSDEREMDARYADHVESQLTAQQRQAGSPFRTIDREVRGWFHGDLGISRQYQVPVTVLLTPRLSVSGGLLVRGILGGWLLACCAALPVSSMRKRRGIFTAPFVLLLAIPTAAMATASNHAELGGPVLVLSLIVAARDFRFAYSILLDTWRAPHLIQARAQGIRRSDLFRVHILPNVLPQFLAVARLSLVTSLGAIVPIEVLFNVPGIGQLAWSAVMNRDLPVLVAVTLVMAGVVCCTAVSSAPVTTMETA